jgi:chaperonin GroEL (HSP60 family)
VGNEFNTAAWGLGLIVFLLSDCREVWEEGKKLYVKLWDCETSNQYRVHTVLVRGFSVLFVERKGRTPKTQINSGRLWRNIYI